MLNTVYVWLTVSLNAMKLVLQSYCFGGETITEHKFNRFSDELVLDELQNNICQKNVLINLTCIKKVIIPNEKFLMSRSFNYLLPIIIILFRVFILNNYNYAIKSSLNIRIVINLYEYSNRRLSIFLITYLLITIVCVVKLVKFERGPLVGRL